ncbi:hypothetical protein [Endozoicomonas elysicola]|uniref:Uncharacterized protein n=1 Tax=Endozoicomonas elysicola TaxID=305900 RepID=A0A081KBZ5_9GAMM|nr:hypothetical protein [Endozoicomonas elysicola]KEI71671.1 hypothetical protein GV64_13825 [Endozoicomonas elysicola]
MISIGADSSLSGSLNAYAVSISEQIKKVVFNDRGCINFVALKWLLDQSGQCVQTSLVERSAVAVGRVHKKIKCENETEFYGPLKSLLGWAGSKLERSSTYPSLIQDELNDTLVESVKRYNFNVNDVKKLCEYGARLTSEKRDDLREWLLEQDSKYPDDFKKYFAAGGEKTDELQAIMDNMLFKDIKELITKRRRIFDECLKSRWVTLGAELSQKHCNELLMHSLTVTYKSGKPLFESMKKCIELGAEISSEVRKFVKQKMHDCVSQGDLDSLNQWKQLFGERDLDELQNAMSEQLAMSAESQNVDQVYRWKKAGVRVNDRAQKALNEALLNALGSGNVELAGRWRRRGAIVPQESREGLKGVLVSASRKNEIDLVAEIIRLGVPLQPSILADGLEAAVSSFERGGYFRGVEYWCRNGAELSEGQLARGGSVSCQ